MKIVTIVILLLLLLPFRNVALALHQFDLVREGGISYKMMRTHDQRRLRRMLPEVVTFPVTGDDDIFTTG
jgi:hypothetical protein